MIDVPDYMGEEAKRFLTEASKRYSSLDSTVEFFNGSRSSLLNRFSGQVKRAIEIGVCKAQFSFEILTRVKPEVLILVDPWGTHDPNYRDAQKQQENYEYVVKRTKPYVDTGRIILMKRESGDALHDNFADGELDFVYIDGDHRFQGVLTDLILCARKVKSTGWICGHDYSKLFGIPEAIDEFCQHYPWKLKTLTVGPHCSFVLTHI